MTYDFEIAKASGNGKHVRVTKVVSRTAGVLSYVGSVDYDADHNLNFDQRFTTKAAAMRWFRTWSKLAA